MPLTDTAIRTAKTPAKAQKLFDGAGLYLLLDPRGGRWWRFKYRYGGKEKLLSLGTYPTVGLRQARESREAARQLLAQGIDPSVERKVSKASQAGPETFEFIAREWLASFSRRWTDDHTERVRNRLTQGLFPWLGSRPISAITAPELLSCVRRVEKRAAYTAHRTLAEASSIFRYAISTGRAQRDTAADLRGALAPVEEKHFASITDPKQIGPLLRAIDGYAGHFVVRCALKLLPLVILRPSELRLGPWSEIDFANREWRIPAERMKMRKPHVVPLSRQALAVLHEIQPWSGDGELIFPGVRAGRPLSDNTMNSALRSMGYDGSTMTSHGFRSMASTLLNEQGWNRDAIERQLAHSESDKTRAAYNYADHLPERRKMLQAWADYLDTLKAGTPGTERAPR